MKSLITEKRKFGFLIRNKPKEENKTTEREDSGACRVLVASDLHYLAPELGTQSPRFKESVENGDGKLSEHGDRIVEEFLSLVMAEKPDALVLAGDLTYNGERLSLVRLCEKLENVRKAGIPVYTIPGNHDIRYPLAADFNGEKLRSAAKISQRDFRTITAEYGVKQAAFKDRYSTSYLAEVTSRVWLLFLDANTEKEKGALTAGTLRWAERVLKLSREKGARVIVVSHQNIVPQNPVFKSGFVVKNYRQVSELLRKYGVETVLSGHAHMTHHEEEEGLTDYCTGALCVAPLMYAELTVSREEILYRTRHLEILQDEAFARFDAGFGRFAQSMMEGMSVPETERKVMEEFAVKTNRAYFSGTLDKERVRAEEGYRLWTEHGKKTFYLQYLKSFTD